MVLVQPNWFGLDHNDLVRPKPFWTDQNCFGHIEGQGIKSFSITIEEARYFFERNSNWNSWKIPQQFKYSKAMTKCWLERLKNIKDEIQGKVKWSSGHIYHFLWYSIHPKLHSSRFKWPEDKLFLLNVFLGYNYIIW